jgi:hypothetical protein
LGQEKPLFSGVLAIKPQGMDTKRKRKFELKYRVKPRKAAYAATRRPLKMASKGREKPMWTQ